VKWPDFDSYRHIKSKAARIGPMGRQIQLHRCVLWPGPPVSVGDTPMRGEGPLSTAHAR